MFGDDGAVSSLCWVHLSLVTLVTVSSSARRALGGTLATGASLVGVCHRAGTPWSGQHHHTITTITTHDRHNKCNEEEEKRTFQVQLQTVSTTTLSVVSYNF